MSARPDYASPYRWNTRYQRWVWASPRRTVIDLAVSTLPAITMTAVAFLDGRIGLGVVGAIASALTVAETVVYLPRAWRAMRSPTRTSHQDTHDQSALIRR